MQRSIGKRSGESVGTDKGARGKWKQETDERNKSDTGRADGMKTGNAIDSRCIKSSPYLIAERIRS